MATRSRRSAEPGEKKRDATRRKLLDRALKLFQKRGVEATTMRDIAKAAGLSLGAAYYYFPSKDALVFAYYEDNQTETEELALRASGDVRARVGAVFHGKLDAMRPHRMMLASIIQRLVNPGDPLSAFSAQTSAVRARAIAVFQRALLGAPLPLDLVPLAAHALWLVHLALMLVYVNDDSPGERRTHGLVDEALDMIIPMLPLLATPMGKALCDKVVGALDRAGIHVAASG